MGNSEFLQKYFGENQNVRIFERQRTQQQVALICFLKLSQESLSHHDKENTESYDDVMCLKDCVIGYSERVNSKPAESRPSTLSQMFLYAGRIKTSKFS